MPPCQSMLCQVRSGSTCFGLLLHSRLLWAYCPAHLQTATAPATAYTHRGCVSGKLKPTNSPSPSTIDDLIVLSKVPQQALLLVVLPLLPLLPTPLPPLLLPKTLFLLLQLLHHHHHHQQPHPV